MEIRSPFLILLDLLEGLIINIIESFKLVYLRMLELIVTLGFISGLNPIGFIVALFVGSIVFYFILKFIFGSSRILFFIFLFYFILLILVAFSLIFI